MAVLTELCDDHTGRPLGRIIDHWPKIYHFAKMVNVLEFVVDITLKSGSKHNSIGSGGSRCSPNS